ncbi:hypothetical protein ACKWTF_010288 [Chironomus riparius]
MYGNVLFRGIEGMKSKQNNNLLTMEGGKKGKLKNWILTKIQFPPEFQFSYSHKIRKLTSCMFLFLFKMIFKATLCIAAEFIISRFLKSSHWITKILTCSGILFLRHHILLFTALKILKCLLKKK